LLGGWLYSRVRQVANLHFVLYDWVVEFGSGPSIASLFVMTQPPENHPRLIGIRTKTARAQEHGQALHGLIREFIKSHPPRVSYEYRKQPGEHVWKLTSEPPTIPLDINALIGDMLYNYRSALDHAIWQLVISNDRVPSRVNQFPIFDDERVYRNRRRQYLSGLSAGAIVAIDSLQPCNGGSEGLSFLNELGNIDKHRHLPVVFVNLAQINLVDPPIEVGPGETINIKMHTGTLERGTEFLIVSCPEMELDFEPTFGIAFGEGTPVENTNVLDVFRSIDEAVQNSLDVLTSHLTRG